MRSILLLVVTACGPAFAPVTVHLAVATERLSLAASVPQLPQPAAPGLPDGGFFWGAADGRVQDVLIGSEINWTLLDAPDLTADCTGSVWVPHSGLSITVGVDAGACVHEYE